MMYESTTPSSVSTTIMRWINDLYMGEEELERKTTAVVELYGRDLLRAYGWEIRRDFEKAESAVYTALKHLYDHELSDSERVSEAKKALADYVSS